MMLMAITVGICANHLNQFYCIPVTWAAILLICYAIYISFSWKFKEWLGARLHNFILGLGIFICFYLIVFGSWEYAIWSRVSVFIVAIPLYVLSYICNKHYNNRVADALNLYGVTIFLPYVILGYIAWQLMKDSGKQKATVLILPIVIVFTFSILGARLTHIKGRLDRCTNYKDKNEWIECSVRFSEKNPVDRYLTELILGSHWKYHTRLCLYDGWRPPYHDPILGFATMFFYYPLNWHEEIKLDDRKRLYHETFPEKPMKFDCKCGKYDKMFYWP